MTIRKLAVLASIVLLLTMACAPIVLGASPPGNQGQALTINFVISEPCGLLTFVDTIASGYHTTSWVKDWYEKKCQSSPAQAKTLAQGKELLDSYTKMLEASTGGYHFVDRTGMELELDKKLLSIAGECSTLPELLQKIRPILRDKDFQTVKSVLTYFAPSYRALVWQPGLKKLTQQLVEFRLQAVKTKMAERLAMVKRFMNAPWVKGLPFTVVLVPLPAIGKGTHGHSMGAVQIVELMPNATFEHDADVIFHEDCHALWFSKPDHVSVEKQFQVAGLGFLPLTELYEGMATALGEGWFTKEAFGYTYKSSWYGDKMINLYSHAVLPLFASYLKSGRVLDAQFARQATLIYFQKFPQAARSIALTSCYLVLADEIPDPKKFRAQINKALPRLREFVTGTPCAEPQSVKAFNDSCADRVAVLTAPDKLDKLRNLGLSAAQIKILRTSALPQPLTLKVKDKNVLFCLGKSFAQQEKLLFAVLEKDKWPLPTN